MDTANTIKVFCSRWKTELPLGGYSLVGAILNILPEVPGRNLQIVFGSLSEIYDSLLYTRQGGILVALKEMAERYSQDKPELCARAIDFIGKHISVDSLDKPLDYLLPFRRLADPHLTPPADSRVAASAVRLVGKVVGGEWDLSNSTRHIFAMEVMGHILYTMAHLPDGVEVPPPGICYEPRPEEILYIDACWIALEEIIKVCPAANLDDLKPILDNLDPLANSSPERTAHCFGVWAHVVDGCPGLLSPHKTDILNSLVSAMCGKKAVGALAQSLFGLLYDATSARQLLSSLKPKIVGVMPYDILAKIVRDAGVSASFKEVTQRRLKAALIRRYAEERALGEGLKSSPAPVQAGRDRGVQGGVSGLVVASAEASPTDVGGIGVGGGDGTPKALGGAEILALGDRLSQGGPGALISGNLAVVRTPGLSQIWWAMRPLRRGGVRRRGVSSSPKQLRVRNPSSAGFRGRAPGVLARPGGLLRSSILR